jgi:hypothetical protein
MMTGSHTYTSLGNNVDIQEKINLIIKGGRRAPRINSKFEH